MWAKEIHFKRGDFSPHLFYHKSSTINRTLKGGIRLFSVYCHENQKNGKVYVGITSIDPKHRWLNGGGYSKNKKFSADIKKYGWTNFSHRIIADGLTEQQALSIEKELISAYDARHMGYNNEDGGKYAHKTALNHEANEVRRGMLASSVSDLKNVQDMIEIFNLAEHSGKNSKICRDVNLAVQAVIERFQRDSRQILYADELFIADFLWEFNRFWKLHIFIHENGIKDGDFVDVDKLFPPYNSHERYEEVWRKTQI